MSLEEASSYVRLDREEVRRKNLRKEDKLLGGGQSRNNRREIKTAAISQQHFSCNEIHIRTHL